MGISTHILNTATGRPGAGVPIALEHAVDDAWVRVSGGVTDADGRWRLIGAEGIAVSTGIYRFHFETAEYYAAQGAIGLYPYIDIVFEVRDATQHYHIPLLITPNAYTTYRGS